MLGKTKNPGGQSAPQKNKYLVIALLCLPFVLCLYLIFGGSGEQAPATVGGLNFNIPDGQTQKIEGNKQKAMEREQMNEQHDARVRTLAEVLSRCRVTRCRPRSVSSPSPTRSRSRATPTGT